MARAADHIRPRLVVGDPAQDLVWVLAAPAVLAAKLARRHLAGTASLLLSAGVACHPSQVHGVDAHGSGGIADS